MKRQKIFALAMSVIVIGLGFSKFFEMDNIVNAMEANQIESSTLTLPTLANSNEPMQGVSGSSKEMDESSTSSSSDIQRNEQKTNITDTETSLSNEEERKRGEQPLVEEENLENPKRSQTKGIEMQEDWQIKTPPSISGYIELYRYLGSDKTNIEIPRDLDGKPTLINRNVFYSAASFDGTKYLSVSKDGSSNGAQLYGDLNGAFNNGAGNSQLETIDLSNANAPTTAVSTVNMFRRLGKVQTIKLPKAMKSTNTVNMFSANSNLTTLDLNGLDTSEVTSMSGMFQACYNLASLDVTNFDTRKVTDMSNMFGSMRSLLDIDVTNFNTDNVTNMSAMFRDCQKISSLELKSFDTSKVTDFGSMFYGCINLQIIDLASFDLPASVNENTIFGNHVQKHPMLIISDDPKLLSIKPSTGPSGLAIMEMSIDTNGGLFTDGSTKKNFFSSITISTDQAKKVLAEIKEFLAANIPTRSTLLFDKWRVTKGKHIDEITSVMDLENTNYSAQWKGPFVSSVPVGLSFSSKIANGQMSIKQSNSLIKNQLIFFADAGSPTNWQVTGQLKWDGKDVPNSSLSTTSAKEVLMSPITDGKWSGGVGSGVTTSTNMTISTTPSVVAEIGTIPFSNYYMIDLGSISLDIVDGSLVELGTYSGSINWDFNFAP